MGHINLNDVQFHFYPEGNEWNEDGPSLTAHAEGYPVGELHWDRKTGEVASIRTQPGAEHNGIATALWDRAQQHTAEHGLTQPRHSVAQSKAGKGWANFEQARDIPRPVPGQMAMFPHWNTKVVK